MAGKRRGKLRRSVPSEDTFKSRPAVPKGKADQLEQGCANCCGKYCRFSKYTNALICG